MTLNFNVTATTVVNFMLDCAESDIRLLRTTYNTVTDSQWQQVQQFKMRLGVSQVQGWAVEAIDAMKIAKEEAQIKAEEGKAIALMVAKKFRQVRDAVTPYYFQALEGVAIALSWLAVGEEFAQDCWQAYVDWAKEFVESRLEPESEPILLENEDQLLCTSLAPYTGSGINQPLSSMGQQVSLLSQVSAIQETALLLQAGWKQYWNSAKVLHVRVLRPVAPVGYFCDME